MNTPPMNGSRNSCLVSTATVPNAPPIASDPTSPIKTSAGGELYQRKPKLAPTIEPQNIVNSAPAGLCVMSKRSAHRASLERYVNPVSAAIAMNVTLVAKPSNPSVRFTAFDEPKSMKTMKIAYIHGQI